MANKVKLVRLKERTYNRLTAYGKWGETMDELVNRLLDEYEKLKEKNASVEMKEKKTKPELWTEKHRPKKIDEMVLEPDLFIKLKSCVETKNIPNLLLYGPVGVGKTTAAHCLVNEIFGENAPLAFKEYNAAELTKKEVRDTIEKLAKCGGIVETPYRICIIDECEKMSGDVESMLRTLMEKYSQGIRFILICNDITHKAITEPIKSRCSIIEFKKPSTNMIIDRLSQIATAENFNISKEELMEIAEKAKGDLRKAVEMLQDKFNARFVDWGELIFK
ncbi:MAG: AAA family ATPase [Candidatus Bathyarchaeia archaeon]